MKGLLKNTVIIWKDSGKSHMLDFLRVTTTHIAEIILCSTMSQHNRKPPSKDSDNTDKLTLKGMAEQILEATVVENSDDVNGHDGASLPSQEVVQRQNAREFVPMFAHTTTEEEDDAEFADLVAGIDALEKQEDAEDEEKNRKQ